LHLRNFATNLTDREIDMRNGGCLREEEEG
jgi:hypothetical protein